MNDLQIFIYSGEQLRTIQREDGLWWVLRDVCQVLSIQNAADIKKRLDDDEKGVGQIYTPGGVQEVTIINEPGLYAVILRSDKPEAKAFKRWVSHDVLPSIRKTGAYGVPLEQIAKLTAAQSSLEDWRNLTAEWDDFTTNACRDYDAARKRYDSYRANRDLCRKNLRQAQRNVDALVNSIASFSKE